VCICDHDTDAKIHRSLSKSTQVGSVVGSVPGSTDGGAPAPCRANRHEEDAIDRSHKPTGTGGVGDRTDPKRMVWPGFTRRARPGATVYGSSGS